MIEMAVRPILVPAHESAPLLGLRTGKDAVEKAIFKINVRVSLHHFTHQAAVTAVAIDAAHDDNTAPAGSNMVYILDIAGNTCGILGRGIDGTCSLQVLDGGAVDVPERSAILLHGSID